MSCATAVPSCRHQRAPPTRRRRYRRDWQVAGVREQLSAALDWLGLRPGPLLVPAALSSLLDSGLMGDRDRAVATDLCSDHDSGTRAALE